MASKSIKTLFNTELTRPELGIPVMHGGKETIDYKPLAPDEEAAIHKCFQKQLAFIGNISPAIAESMRPQEQEVVKWGGVAKGMFPEEKPIRYPAVSGTLGVDILCPALYNYQTAAFGAAYPAYNQYVDAIAPGPAIGDTWDIDFTAGVARYLAGDAAATYYKASPTTSQHSFICLLKDGILEVNSAPTLTQLRVYTDSVTKFSPTIMSPLVEETLEEDKNVYQYQTPGMIPLMHNVGTNISVMPARTGRSEVPLLGFVFYEYDLWSTLKT